MTKNKAHETPSGGIPRKISGCAASGDVQLSDTFWGRPFLGSLWLVMPRKEAHGPAASGPRRLSISPGGTTHGTSPLPDFGSSCFDGLFRNTRPIRVWPRRPRGSWWLRPRRLLPCRLSRFRLRRLSRFSWFRLRLWLSRFRFRRFRLSLFRRFRLSLFRRFRLSLFRRFRLSWLRFGRSRLRFLWFGRSRLWSLWFGRYRFSRLW